MNRLDRAGIFKAKPIAMGLKPGRETKSVAVWIEFHILAQRDGDGWVDWFDYEDHSIIGEFNIVKKDGTVNERGVANLAEVLDWNGDPDTIVGDPPDIPVQITVGEETYNNVTRLKVQWLNSVDYQGGIQSATPEQVKQIKAQFGSLLRAAAGAARKPKADAKPKKASPPKQESIAYAGQFDPNNPNG